MIWEQGGRGGLVWSGDVFSNKITVLAFLRESGKKRREAKERSEMGETKRYVMVNGEWFIYCGLHIRMEKIAAKNCVKEKRISGAALIGGKAIKRKGAAKGRQRL